MGKLPNDNRQYAMTKHISSPNNPLIKHAVVLKNKARMRKEQQLFIAEGLREMGLALQNGFEAATLFYDPEITPQKEVERLLENATTPPNKIITVNQAVLDKIAYRSSVPNVVGIFKNKAPTLLLEDSKAQNPLYLVLEGIEKPGNLGAVLRTADAAGVDGVFVCEPSFDLFNPNAIRASLGAIFTVPIYEMLSVEVVGFLKNRNIPIYATWLEAARPLFECNLTGPTALVLGAEATGITPFWIEQADERIIIPMSGQIDSLNVSTSAAIVLFEVVRQRLV